MIRDLTTRDKDGTDGNALSGIEELLTIRDLVTEEVAVLLSDTELSKEDVLEIMVTREVAITNIATLRHHKHARPCAIDKEIATDGSSMVDTEGIATNGN